MIHYDGPQNCTSCLLKFYYKWDDVMDKIGRDNVDYLFVLGPQEDMSIDKIRQSLNENYTSCLVAVDVNGEFRESNPSITQSDNVDILLNKDNEVLGVFHIMENNDDVDDIRKIVMDYP